MRGDAGWGPFTARTVSRPRRAESASTSAPGAGFAGFIAHSRNPDLLSTRITVAFTFFAALLGLFVLHVVYRLAVVGAKVAIPVGLVLLIGCAMDWPWARTSVRWLRAAGAMGGDAVARGWSALEAGDWNEKR